MSKFMIGDRVQVNGEPTDWNLGTVTGLRSHFGQDGCDIDWDSQGTTSVGVGDLFLVHRPSANDAPLTIPAHLMAARRTPEPSEPLADWEKGLLEPPTFAEQVDTILNSVGALLKQKNEAYGDSALNPVRIFSKADPADGLRVRIDDKLSRIARGSDAGEDTVTDLLGYLVMLKISEENK